MHTDTSASAPPGVAQAYLAALGRYGIDLLYVGAGTDTAPIIEAYASVRADSSEYPKPVLAIHENLAVAMAHGYYLATGRPQAVMLHVSVGTANAVCALMNAARAQVPVLFTAGRTPLFEEGPPGARSLDIHWGQEMFDQAGMVRELVKWDYELRDGINVEEIVARAYTIAMSEPRGPVYLTLPREVLARAAPARAPVPLMPRATAPHPDPAAVDRLADALMAAQVPVIVCCAGGIDPQTVPLLTGLAERFGVGVAESWPRYVNFPDSHPLHLGFGVERLFGQADALLFVECDVPWVPAAGAPRAEAFVAHAGSDPLYGNYPVRSFRSDLTVTAGARALLEALTERLEAKGAAAGAAQRRERLEALGRAARLAVDHRLQADAELGGPVTKAFFSHCLNQVLPEEAVLVNEYPAIREHLSRSRPGSFFNLPSAGGLGWGLPAALGIQQARPDALVVSSVGDGAYVFANPAACHQAAAMHGLPVLTVIYDNGRWDAVQKATLRLYPDSSAAAHARAHGAVPLSSLAPVPSFEQYVAASGGYGEVVDSREALLPALRRALRVVREERRQAVVRVVGA